MPNAHNGYYDAILATGYLGLGLLGLFIVTTLNAIGSIADQDRSRAWIALSVALFIVVNNGLETIWMRGFEFLWIVFLILAAEAARLWRPARGVGLAPQQVAAAGGRLRTVPEQQFARSMRSSAPRRALGHR